MDAKQVSNSIRKYKGVRVFPTPPTTLGKQGKEEWDRLINSLYITDKDIGSLIIACQSYEIYLDLYEVITTVFYEDKAGKKRKRKISVAEYCSGRNSQQQVELTTMNKALDNYNKIIKRFTENNALTGMEEQDNEETISAAEMELMEQLL